MSYVPRNQPFQRTPEQQAAIDRSKKYKDPIRHGGFYCGTAKSKYERLDEIVPRQDRMVRP